MSVLLAYDVSNNKQREMKVALLKAGFRDNVANSAGGGIIGLPNTTVVGENMTTVQALELAKKLATALGRSFERVIAVGWTEGSAEGVPYPQGSK